ncbi:hypothetical protein WJX81_008465 [Elliptochloris bilobata]|uniref:ABC-type xenobiotic transporter n=1 Tax=Elliptochloris bilobata TaxID=381761 RepID=A0AAW1QV45_9CHLO
MKIDWLLGEDPWAWACGQSSPQVWYSRGHCFHACFSDLLLLAGRSALVICGLAWWLRELQYERSQAAAQGPLAGAQPPRKPARNCLERSALLQTIPVLIAACALARLMLACYADDGFARLLAVRPHVLIAVVAEAAAWLLCAGVLGRHLSERLSRPIPAGMPPLWLLQAAAATLADCLPVLYFKAEREDIPRLASAGLQVAFLVLVMVEQRRLWRRSAAGLDIGGSGGGNPAAANGLAEPLLAGTAAAADPGLQAEGGWWGRRLGMGWVTPLVALGARRQLCASDLFQLPADLQPDACAAVLWREWTQERVLRAEQVASGRCRPARLLAALWRAFGGPFVCLGGLKLCNDALNFAGPLLLNALLQHLSAGASGGARPARPDPGWPAWLPAVGSPSFGYWCAALLGLTSAAKALLNAQYNYGQGRLACRLRAAITAAVFDKALLVGGADAAAFDSGSVQTLMSVDSDRIVALANSAHELWSLPLQILVALVLLYTQVQEAFLAGLAVVLLLIPINRVLSRRIEAASTAMMAYKDARVRRTGELLRGIRQIKAAAWERCFVSRVTEARAGELAALAVRKYLDALCVYFWAATPLLQALLTFSMYVMLGRPLTAPIVFTSLALFNVLTAPLNSFPWVVNGCIEAIVSVRRLQRFLAAPETDAVWVYAARAADPSPPPLHLTARSLPGGSPAARVGPRAPDLDLGLSPNHWGQDSAPELSAGAFTDISLAVRAGSFMVVVGEVGAGKSSLLAAILGELQGVAGRARVRGRMAYAPQAPWLLSGSLRENILLGAPMEAARYAAVLEACALGPDLAALPGGDLARVGDRGTRLSGGQRARVALARAIYQERDVYLFDDVLAAVDQPVADHLLRSALTGPLLAGKTRILVSHSPAAAAAANMLVRLRRGAIAYVGPPEGDAAGEARTAPAARSARLVAPQRAWQSRSAPAAAVPVPAIAAFEEWLSAPIGVSSDEYDLQSPPLHAVREEPLGSPSGSGFGVPPESPPRWPPPWGTAHAGGAPNLAHAPMLAGGDLLAEGTPVALQLQEEEEEEGRQVGHVRWAVYAHAARMLAGLDHVVGGSGLGLLPGVRFHLSVLLLFTAANSLFTLVRAFAFAQGGLVAAARLHERLLGAIVAAPAAFFDATPAGRVLNRFSSDAAVADDALPFILNILLANLAALLGVAVVLAFGQPLLAAAFLPLALLYRWLQTRYQRSSREIRRLASVARSPVYNGFFEALEGAASIRAFQVQAAFAGRNIAAITALQRANLASVAAAQWLAVRLQLLAAALVAAVALLAVLGSAGLLPWTSAHSDRAGLVGLSLSYALPITGLLNGLLTSSAETEQEMVAVERMLEFSRIPPQPETLPVPIGPPSTASPMAADRAPCFTFPSSRRGPAGAREGLADTAYRDDHGPAWALAGLDLEIRPGERLGLVGRTGAGKSSVVAALLRLAETQAGRITMDGLDIRSVPLARLRDAIGVVPQAPFLFEGTIRENLDPAGRFSDRALISLCRKMRLWDIMAGLSLLRTKRHAASPRAVPQALGSGAYGAPPRSPSSLSRSNTPRGPSALWDPPSAQLRVAGAAGSPALSSLDRVSVLAEEGRCGPWREPSSPSLEPPERGAPRRLGAGGQRGLSPNPRPSRLSPGRLLGGRWAAGLAAEPTGVLVHSGFGQQLLSMRLGEGGAGLSLGQQQLVCLARVILRRPQIVCLDECTASVDPATAALMQDLLRAELPHATVLQVAHRLEAVLDSDRVAVMDSGVVVEAGAPRALLADPASRLSAIHQASWQ